MRRRILNSEFQILNFAGASTVGRRASSKAAEVPMLRRITVLAVLAAGAHLAAQQDFQWNGQLTTGQTLEIKGINGDIHAGPSSTTGAAVTAVKSARRSNPADVRIEVVPYGGGVTICAVYPDVPGAEPNRCEPGRESRSHTKDNDTTVRFDVQVPVGVALVARTVNGSIDGE